MEEKERLNASDKKIILERCPCLLGLQRLIKVDVMAMGGFLPFLHRTVKSDRTDMQQRLSGLGFKLTTHCPSALKP